MGNKNLIYYGTAIVLFALGLTLGALLFNEPEKVCPSYNLTCPNIVIPECPAITSCTPVYQSCVDEDTAEEDAELYGEETGKTIYEMKSSRTCKDFLENSYLREDKKVIAFSDIEDGCKLFYVIE